MSSTSAALLRRVLVAVLIAVAGSSGSAPALADRAAPTEEERTRAAELKKKGDDAMVSLRYADALAAYEDAYALVDDPALLYNRARAHQLLGQFPEALAQFSAFDAQAPAALKGRVAGLASLIADVRGRVTVVTVISNVDGARVLVRDRSSGTTPLAAPLTVNAGKASIEVSAEGYHPFHKEVELPGGGTLTVDAKLFSRATSGVLTIASPTAGTRVTVDGRASGTVPVEVIVPAGVHKLSLHHAGFLDVETSAVVEVGERKQISVAMEAERPVTAKWWFWTGVGVVVAGGVVLTAVLLTDKSAPKGTIEPGQVAAPIRRAAVVRF